MRLYHFTSQNFGLLAIKDRRLKIARINELNDPFEFLGCNTQDPETRTRLRRWKADRNVALGILCFSSKWSNPLLWGHYADKHRGMALGFDVTNDDMYSPVKYRRTRLPGPSSRELVSADENSLLLTKFSAWRYESEHRRFCRLDQATHENGLYFQPFSPTLKLAEVIVGAHSTVTRGELAAALGDQDPHATSFKARPAFGDFSVVKNQSAGLWK